MLDRLDRLVDETVSSVAVPPDARARGRENALALLAAAGDDRSAVAVLTLGYASDLVQAIAVDLAARPDDAVSLFAGIEAVSGLSRATLARDLLHSPRFSELAPKVAVEVQLSLLVGFSDARAVSLWTSGSDDTPRQLASAGTPAPEDGDARELASQLLARQGTETVGTAIGLRLDQRIERPAALVAHARPPGTDHRMMLLRIIAPPLESALERGELLRRDRASEQTVISAVERRLARLRYDLHDGPQQDVHLLATDLALFREQLVPIIREHQHRDRIVGRLDDLAAELVALDGDLRRLASTVQSPFLPLGSLPESLRELTDAFSVRTGIAPDTRLRGDFSVLSESQQITLLALIREALSNVREHAEASTVTIAVSASPKGAEAQIVDNGRGFEPEATLVRAAREGHLGLVGMHERVRMLGGRTEIESRRGGPTVISVRLPAWPPRLTCRRRIRAAAPSGREPAHRVGRRATASRRAPGEELAKPVGRDASRRKTPAHGAFCARIRARRTLWRETPPAPRRAAPLAGATAPERSRLRPIPPILSMRSGSRGGCPPRLPQNRTYAVRIRLFGTAGYDPRRRPVCDLEVIPTAPVAAVRGRRRAGARCGACRSGRSARAWRSTRCAGP